MGLWTHATREKALTRSSSRKTSASGWSGFTELAGLSWEEFAERLGVELDRVMEWRNGTIPTGGEVWHIMRLAWSVPGGIEIMLPEIAEGGE